MRETDEFLRDQSSGAPPRHEAGPLWCEVCNG
jgi:hypothetical protein